MSKKQIASMFKQANTTHYSSGKKERGRTMLFKEVKHKLSNHSNERIAQRITSHGLTFESDVLDMEVIATCNNEKDETTRYLLSNGCVVDVSNYSGKLVTIVWERAKRVEKQFGNVSDSVLQVCKNNQKQNRNNW